MTVLDQENRGHHEDQDETTTENEGKREASKLEKNSTHGWSEHGSYPEAGFRNGDQLSLMFLRGLLGGKGVSGSKDSSFSEGNEDPDGEGETEENVGVVGLIKESEGNVSKAND